MTNYGTIFHLHFFSVLLSSLYIVVNATSSWDATHICNHCYLLIIIDYFQNYQVYIWIYIYSYASVLVHTGYRVQHREVYYALFLVGLWTISSHCDMLCENHWVLYSSSLSINELCIGMCNKFWIALLWLLLSTCKISAESSYLAHKFSYVVF